MLSNRTLNVKIAPGITEGHKGSDSRDGAHEEVSATPKGKTRYAAKASPLNNLVGVWDTPPIPAYRDWWKHFKQKIFRGLPLCRSDKSRCDLQNC
jgi:hypothetical protein